MSRARPQAGFTLTEMMTVIAIIGVLSTLAWSSFRSDARPADVASTSANLIREAARKAVAGGVVRADVVRRLANSKARSRIRIFTAAGSQFVVVERLVETAVDADPPAVWVETMRQKIPRGNQIAGLRASADLTGGVGPATALGAGDEPEIRCEPSGICQAATIYFQDTHGPRRARAVIMPLGGAPAIFTTW